VTDRSPRNPALAQVGTLTAGLHRNSTKNPAKSA